MKHLKQASQAVANWPQWKKDAAGIGELVKPPSLDDLLCFDFNSDNDIGFTHKLQKMLNVMGFETESSASDEDGCSHSIDVENAYCIGQIHTSEGRIMAMRFEYTKEE